MAGWRRVVELAMTCEEIERLTALSRSRTEPASRVSRAQMLLAYRGESFVLCGGATSWGSSSNGSALRGAGAAQPEPFFFSVAGIAQLPRCRARIVDHKYQPSNLPANIPVAPRLLQQPFEILRCYHLP